MPKKLLNKSAPNYLMTFARCTKLSRNILFLWLMGRVALGFFFPCPPTFPWSVNGFLLCLRCWIALLVLRALLFDMLVLGYCPFAFLDIVLSECVRVVLYSLRIVQKRHPLAQTGQGDAAYCLYSACIAAWAAQAFCVSEWLTEP